MLELFHKMPCPYSKMVRDFIAENNLQGEINYRDVLKDQANADELMRITGRKTVPCLMIDGKPMFESRDIVDYLGRHFGVSQAQPQA